MGRGFFFDTAHTREVHHGGMRLFVLLAVALAACTPSSSPPPAAQAPVPAAPPAASAPAPQPQLPAAEPAAPTLRQFRRQAETACAAAAREVNAYPLAGDPLRDDATAQDRRAAVAHYRAMAGAWRKVAEDLWVFGLPDEKAGELLITRVDTVAQYSQQTAEFLDDGDLPTAQAAVAAVEESLRNADAIARRIGMTPISECGLKVRRLSGVTPVPVDAFDFDFDAGAVSAGPTRFVMRNRGRERHQLFVVRLRNGGTLAEAIRADRAGQTPSQFLAGDGDVSPVALPGGRTTVDVRLRQGAYGLVCFVASPDGTPHAYKGMATEIFVE